SRRIYFDEHVGDDVRLLEHEPALRFASEPAAIKAKRILDQLLEIVGDLTIRWRRGQQHRAAESRHPIRKLLTPAREVKVSTREDGGDRVKDDARGTSLAQEPFELAQNGRELAQRFDLMNRLFGVFKDDQMAAVDVFKTIVTEKRKVTDGFFRRVAHHKRGPLALLQSLDQEPEGKQRGFL